MEGLLVRTCNACLQEISELRRDVWAVDTQVRTLEARLDAILSVPPTSGTPATSGKPQSTQSTAPPPPEQVDEGECASPSSPSAHAKDAFPNVSTIQVLQESCGVEHTSLGKLIASACERGDLRVELRDLRQSWALAATDEDPDIGRLRVALTAALRNGTLRGAAYNVDSVAPLEDAARMTIRRASPNDVPEELENAIAQELTAPEGDESCRLLDSLSTPSTLVVFGPVFRRCSLQLIEVVLHWCKRERVTPVLSEVHRLARTLLDDGGAFKEEDLLTLVRTGATGVEVVASAGAEMRLRLTNSSKGRNPMPPYAADDVDKVLKAAAAGDQDAAELNAVAEAWAQHAHTMSAFFEGGQEDDPSRLLDLLCVLRDPCFSQALGLPNVLRSARAGSLLWACAHRKKAGPSQPPARTKAARATVPPASVATGAAERIAAALAAAASAKASAAAHPVPMADVRVVAGMPSHPVVEDVQPVMPMAPATLPMAPSTLLVPPTAPPPCSAQVLSSSALPITTEQDEGEDDDDDDTVHALGELNDKQKELNGKPLSILKQQLAFVECFQDELFEQRTLLLSQLNNLYKMRSGTELPYKVSGYEKLRDFLVDIPGLCLSGRGNRMQVQLSSHAELEAFRDNLREATQSEDGTPQFRMPKPLPPSLLQQIRDLFLNAEGFEIPLRSFLAVWNERYPNEQLAYRALGFRDVRGLLSQVQFIEKVGGKLGAKYVLKPNERHGVPAAVPKSLPMAQPDASSRTPQQHSSSVVESGLGTNVRMGAPGQQRPAPVQATRMTVGLDASARGPDSPTLIRRQPPVQPPVQPPQQIVQAQHYGDAARVAPLRAPMPYATAPGIPGMAVDRSPYLPQQPAAQQYQRPGQLQPVVLPLDPMYNQSSVGYGALQQAAQFSTSAFGQRPPPVPGYSAPMAVNPIRPTMPSQPPPVGAPPANMMPSVPYPNRAPEPGDYGLGPPAAAKGFGDVARLNTFDELPEIFGRTAVDLSQSAPVIPDSSAANRVLLEQRLRDAGAWDGGMASYGMDATRVGAPGGAAFGLDPPPHCPDGGDPQSGWSNPNGPLGSGAPVFLQPPEPALGSGVGSLAPVTETGVADVSAVGDQSSQSKWSLRKQGKIKKTPASFVSTPGAFISSQDRDASVQQGRFDMGSVLQTHMRPGTPCLVCDTSQGQVAQSNPECDALFEASEHGRLVHNDLLSLIDDDYRHSFCNNLEYLRLSEKSRMDAMEIRIITLTGQTRQATIEGQQLIGTWWQFEFRCYDDGDPAHHGLG